MKEIIDYYIKYFPEWITKYSAEEFIKIFSIYKNQIKKLSELPSLSDKIFKKYERS